MKNIQMRMLVVAGFFIGALCATGCDDSETYDVTGVKGNRVYVNLGKIGGMQNLLGTANIIHTPVMEVGNNTTVSFTVSCTSPASSDIKISFSDSEALVDAYNQAHETSYTALPTTAVKIGVLGDANGEGSRPLTATTTVTIPKGAIVSDSLSVQIVEGAWASLKEPSYLIALKVSEITGGGAALASNEGYDTVYLLVDTEEKLINSAPTDADLETATLYADRSIWTITSSTSIRSGAIANLTDANTGTNCRFSSNPYNMDIDLGSVQNIAGLQFYTVYAQYGASYQVSRVEVEYSMDGITYSKAGTADGDALLLESTLYQDVVFYGHIQAQYLRLSVTQSYNYGLAEFNIYVK